MLPPSISEKGKKGRAAMRLCLIEYHYNRGLFRVFDEDPMDAVHCGGKINLSTPPTLPLRNAINGRDAKGMINLRILGKV